MENNESILSIYQFLGIITIGILLIILVFIIIFLLQIHWDLVSTEGDKKTRRIMKLKQFEDKQKNIKLNGYKYRLFKIEGKYSYIIINKIETRTDAKCINSYSVRKFYKLKRKDLIKHGK